MSVRAVHPVCFICAIPGPGNSAYGGPVNLEVVAIPNRRDREGMAHKAIVCEDCLFDIETYLLTKQATGRAGRLKRYREAR